MAFAKDDSGKYYYNGEINGEWDSESQKSMERFVSDLMEGLEKKEDVWDGIKYFRPGEFKCKCGGKYCNGFPVIPERKLLELSDDVREHFGASMLISSGLRCDQHNANVGGVSNSRHKKGKAVDFRISGKSSLEVVEFVKKDPRVRYAYAIDNLYIHMDIE